MTTKTITASEAKNSFGLYLDSVQREPVIITKKSRPVALTISYEDAEDLMLLDQAKEAGKSGFVSAEESAEALKVALNA